MRRSFTILALLILATLVLRRYTGQQKATQNLSSQKEAKHIMQKKVIVSGGSSGIGLAVVKRFVEQGDSVFNLDIIPSKHGIFVHCDVSNHDSVVQALKHISQQGVSSAVDVVVCNAGKHLSANIENTSEDDLITLFNLNVKGAFSTTQSALPFMKEKGGSIIYVASDQALIAKHNSFAYNLSKHALASMAKTTALDYASFNIRANAVCPGTIETPLYHKAIEQYCEKSGANIAEVHQEEANMQPLGRIGKAEEVAAMVAFLASDEASFVTGSLQVIDGGYTAQ